MRGLCPRTPEIFRMGAIRMEWFPGVAPLLLSGRWGGG